MCGKYAQEAKPAVEYLSRLTEQLQRERRRACVVLAGEENWQQTILLDWLIPLPKHSGLWVGETSPYPQLRPVSLKDAKHYLGQETTCVVFSEEAGIEPNSLGILSGMVKAGGVVFILFRSHGGAFLPNPAVQKYLNTPYALSSVTRGFSQFLWSQLKQTALFIEQGQALPSLPIQSDAPRFLVEQPTYSSYSSYSTYPTPTLDQQKAIKAIEKVAFGHRKRPLVLTAARGRGKSTALGLAALALIARGRQNIVMTAARPQQIAQAMDIVQQAGAGSKVLFIPPDKLIDCPVTPDILLVDEAAHLPLPMLEKLIARYHRLVLATTRLGYEGSGKGFEIKLSVLLDRMTPGWQKTVLNQPIRWQAGDYLEQTIHQVLLLAECPLPEYYPQNNAPIAIQRLDGQALLNQPLLLEQLFQLMCWVHYQTSPNDLMQWLEVPNLVFWVAQQATPQGKYCVGAVIAIKEGGLSFEPQQALQGHLVPRWLHKHYDEREDKSPWLTLKSLRIMRIAVQPNYQQQGIGTQLMHRVVQDSNEFAFLSASFGASVALLPFWQKQGFSLVGLGLKKDKASGQPSAFMLKGLSASVQGRIETLQTQFQTQFAYLLLSAFSDLDSQLVIGLLAQLNYPSSPFPQGYLTHQPYEAVSAKLRDWLLASPSFLQSLSPEEARLFVAKWLQNQPDSQKSIEQQRKAICQRSGLLGRYFL